ncbi:MAG TPA: C1 family peptidase, partial [Tahibacter sp.]|nr:C1 family peptidase [Tahibacter sp.]
LADRGICLESEWPYDPVPIAGNPAQGDAINPSLTARFSAGLRRIKRHHYAVGARRGNAASILALLRQGRPVAVSVPVFHDAIIGRDNWNMPGGEKFGAVANPPPSSVVNGGHAVLIVGYVPNSLDPLGGMFIFRNSWSTSWGYELPSPGQAAPRPGYGEMPASYIDAHLWEYAAL